MTAEEVLFFDRIAPDWDGMEIRSTPEKVNSILDLVKVEEGSDVLDLGTGTGVLLPWLSSRVGKSGSVKGVDISEGMLMQARSKCGALPNVSFLKSDFEKEQLEGRYDLIMLYCVYPHLHYPLQTLSRLKECNLKPGGRIIVGFPGDEDFINGIHGKKKAPHELLPDPFDLADYYEREGFSTHVLAADYFTYLVELW